MLQALKRIAIFFVIVLAIIFVIPEIFRATIQYSTNSPSKAEIAEDQFYTVYDLKYDFLSVTHKARELLKEAGGNRLTLDFETKNDYDYEKGRWKCEPECEIPNFLTSDDDSYYSKTGPAPIKNICYHWEDQYTECNEIVLSENLKQSVYRIRNSTFDNALYEIIVTQNNVYFCYSGPEYILAVSETEPIIEDWGIADFSEYQTIHFEDYFYLYKLLSEQ
jgi:hypothetical protein